MTDLREAAEMALEVFEHLSKGESPAITKGELVYEIAALRQALAQPEQEPVAWMYTSHYKGNEWFITRYQSELTTYKADKVQPLYTAPPKREWVGLEDEDVATVKNDFNRGALWAEAKLKEKNT